MKISSSDNLAPDRFIFWTPPANAFVRSGAESLPVALPPVPLPVGVDMSADGAPSDAAIGQGVYDYLRQFPDCAGNTIYAELLLAAYPHFLADLASHAIMLDAKHVEPSYVVRKLTCLKILRLIEPRNRGLLWQLGRGYFDLALDFSALSECRQHLREAMRFGQELLALDPADQQALSLLAEVDLLFGDIPAAKNKWQRLVALVDDPVARGELARRISAWDDTDPPQLALVDELEVVADAMQLHAIGDDVRATCLLDRIAEQGKLPLALPSADFFCLLGLCRLGAGDRAGAFVALQQALDCEPGHAVAQAALDSL